MGWITLVILALIFFLFFSLDKYWQCADESDYENYYKETKRRNTSDLSSLPPLTRVPTANGDFVSVRTFREQCRICGRILPIQELMLGDGGYLCRSKISCREAMTAKIKEKM